MANGEGRIVFDLNLPPLLDSPHPDLNISRASYLVLSSYLRRLLQPACAGDAVSIAKPEVQRSLKAHQDGLLPLRIHNMSQDHRIGILAMTGFHHLMRSDEIQAIR
jgi:hypothetical protein